MIRIVPGFVLVLTGLATGCGGASRAPTRMRNSRVEPIRPRDAGDPSPPQAVSDDVVAAPAAQQTYPAFQDAQSYFRYAGAFQVGQEKAVGLRDGSTKAWVRRRRQHSAQGKPDIVRLPLVMRSVGWGCDCPRYLLGDDPASVAADDDTAWIRPEPEWPKEAHREGAVWMVEGYFRARQSEYPSGDPGARYPLSHLVVLRAFRPSEDRTLRMQVVLENIDPKDMPPALPADKPFLVVVRSIAASDPQASVQIDAFLALLAQHGFEDRQVIDSRAGAALSIGYHVVVAGCYATHAEAQEVAGRVRQATGRRPYVKHAFERPED